MNKNVIMWHGRKYFLLGEGTDNRKYYLENASFDCGWYWGIGYIESFTNNRNPELSRDIASHNHFDSVIFGQRENGFDTFKKEFPVNPFSDSEIWKICEIMKACYIARKYSDMLHIGGAHYTSNPAAETIKNEKEYKRINEIMIPKLLDELEQILTGGTEK